MTIQFEADEVFIKQMKLDKSWRVELGTSEGAYSVIRDLPLMQGRVMKVTIETDG